MPLVRVCGPGRATPLDNKLLLKSQSGRVYGRPKKLEAE